MAIGTIIGTKTFKPQKGFREILKREIREMIVKEDISVFLIYFDSYFTEYCVKLIREIKKEFLYLKIIQVRGKDLLGYDVYQDYVQKYVNDVVRPKCLEEVTIYSHFLKCKYAIDNSDCILFYYDKNCRLPMRAYWYSEQPDEKLSIKGVYNYAVEQNKKIINVFEKNKKAY